jgi:dCMP deaminase
VEEKLYGQNPDHVRPTWDEYFLRIMEEVSTRGTCDRGQAGAVIVKEKRILSTGYNGAPPGLSTCDEIGHLMVVHYDEKGIPHQHCVRTVHAESNAIAQAAKFGICIQGSTMYCKMEPCLDCTKLILSVGIKRVVAQRKYHAASYSRLYFSEAKVMMEVVEDKLEEGRYVK